jgi:hypothetical protein
MIKILRASADKSPELQVEPDGLETSSPDDSVDAFQVSATKGTEDALVDLFRRKFEVPVETFLQQLRAQRVSIESHSR